MQFIDFTKISILCLSILNARPVSSMFVYLAWMIYIVSVFIVIFFLQCKLRLGVLALLTPINNSLQKALITFWFGLQAIQRLVEHLCHEVRLVAKELVDVFGIPDFILRAPIGLSSRQYSEYSHLVGF